MEHERKWEKTKETEKIKTIWNKVETYEMFKNIIEGERRIKRAGGLSMKKE